MITDILLQLGALLAILGPMLLADRAMIRRIDRENPPIVDTDVNPTDYKG